MRSWKDYNVLRESTPVEDRDRIAAEMKPLRAMYDPDYARANLKDRSYSRNEDKYETSACKVANMVRRCMKNLGIDANAAISPQDYIAPRDLHRHCNLQDSLTSKTSPFVSVSLYFMNISNGGTEEDIPALKDFIRKVAQGKELYVDVDTSSNPSFFTDDTDLQAEFNETFKNVLETRFSNEFSKKQINFMLKLITHCQDGTDNSCRALKSAINSGLITLSCYRDPYEKKLHIYYTFPVSTTTSDREKTLLTQAMTDIVDFTNTLNGEEEHEEE